MNITPEQIDQYLGMVVSAPDNAAFMRYVELTNTDTLWAVVERLQLPVDTSKGRRLGPLTAVRKELARRRQTRQ